MSGFDLMSGNQYLEVAAQVCFSRAENWQKKIFKAGLDGDNEALNRYTLLRDEAGSCKTEIRSLKVPHTEEDLVRMLVSMCNEVANKFENPVYASMHRMATQVLEEMEKSSKVCESA